MQAASENDLTRVERWEDRTTWPLFFGSLLLFASVTLTWVDQHPSPVVRAVSAFAVLILWVWFIVDYLIRLRLARGARHRFVRTRIFDLASLVLPFLRPFLLLVYIWRLPVFRHGSASMQRVRYGVVTVLFGFLYVYVCSYLVWAAEKNAPRANIVNFEDAVWWGFSTIATVGYGDFVPITALGRTLAVGLMIGGIVVVGFVTATLLSSLTDRIRSMGLSGAERAQGSDAAAPGAADPKPEEAAHQARIVSEG